MGQCLYSRWWWLGARTRVYIRPSLKCVCYGDVMQPHGYLKKLDADLQLLILVTIHWGKRMVLSEEVVTFREAIDFGYVLFEFAPILSNSMIWGYL